MVPNPGPLAIFTSGLYPGHSSQYNRATSGRRKWVKIGETLGYGSFHIAADTVTAIDELNRAVDGYSHITRSFGEGASARFRAIGKALSFLSLPDLRRHDTRRPLYVLPLVDDPGGVILGWSSPVDISYPAEQELADQWWRRWVAGDSTRLAKVALESPNLLDELRALANTALSNGDIGAPAAFTQMSLLDTSRP
jgi:hypothetical protein